MEMKELEPFKLRDHLVPFLFDEFKSEQTVIMPGLKTKAIKLNRRSSLCRIITMVHARYDEKVCVEPNSPGITYDYKLQFSIKMGLGGMKYESSLYKSYKHIYEKLYFSKSDNQVVNGFFEDIFRTAFIYYVSSAKDDAKCGNIRAAINRFMDKYELLELGFDNEALRVLYYRETGKENKLSRFQHKMANKVYNF